MLLPLQIVVVGLPGETLGVLPLFGFVVYYVGFFGFMQEFFDFGIKLLHLFQE